jgi:predicted N-acetyltransferase YhbS
VTAIRQEDKRDYRSVFELNQLAFGQDNEAKLVDALRKNVFMAIELVSDYQKYNPCQYQPVTARS